MATLVLSSAWVPPFPPLTRSPHVPKDTWHVSWDSFCDSKYWIPIQAPLWSTSNLSFPPYPLTFFKTQVRAAFSKSCPPPLT